MIENLEGEIWKSVGFYRGIDFTGCYEVSNKGRLKALDRTVTRGNGRKQFWAERILKQFPDKRGYPRVYLKKDGETRSPRTHQLVALRFVENPNPQEYIQINHKDENKINNCAENLEWCTAKYNNNYGTHPERCSKGVVLYAKKRRVPVVQLSLDGEFIKKYDSYIDTEQDGFSGTHVSACARGIYHTSKGYKWMKLSDYEKMIQEQNG